MTTITIRNVPEPLRAELASRASSSGQSLQEYLLRQLAEIADRQDMHALMARIRERKEKSGTRLTAEQILKYRDAGRE